MGGGAGAVAEMTQGRGDGEAERCEHAGGGTGGGSRRGDVTWGWELGGVEAFPYGSVCGTGEGGGGAGGVLVVGGLAHVARARVASMAGQRLAKAGASVLASRRVRLGAGGLVELRVEGSDGRVNGEREGSRSVRVNCSPPHMKIRGVHGVGVLIRGHGADGSYGGGGSSGLRLGVGSDGRVDHGRGILIVALRTCGRMARSSSCGCSSGCHGDGIVGELVRVMRCGRWRSGTVQAIRVGHARGGCMSVTVGTVGRAVGAAGSSGCSLCSFCGALWTAGFGGGGRATGLGGLGWRVAFGGFFAVATAVLL